MKIKRIVAIVVLVYIVLGVLGTMGVDVSSIVASLGLLGFAFGYALRDTIGNLIAGVLIKLDKHFEVGDKIKVGGYQGTIAHMNLRYTILGEAEKGTHYVPNKMLFNTPVTILKKNEDV